MHVHNDSKAGLGWNRLLSEACSKHKSCPLFPPPKPPHLIPHPTHTSLLGWVGVGWSGYSVLVHTWCVYVNGGETSGRECD